MAQTGPAAVSAAAPQVVSIHNAAPVAQTDKGTELGERLSTVTFCIPADELRILKFAAEECGQTLSKFCYVRIRNELRAMQLLPMPTIPKMNGGARHAS